MGLWINGINSSDESSIISASETNIITAVSTTVSATQTVLNSAIFTLQTAVLTATTTIVSATQTVLISAINTTETDIITAVSTTVSATQTVLISAINTAESAISAMKTRTDYLEYVVSKSVTSIVSGATTFFDIAGNVEITSLFGIVTTYTEDIANNFYFQLFDGFSTTQICQEALINNKSAGALMSIVGSATFTAPLTVSPINGISSTPISILTACTAIRGVFAASISGAITFYCKYKPVSSTTAVVTSA